VDVEDLYRKAEWLRSAEPPRALRGFEEEHTRRLLDDVAHLLQAVAQEQEEMQRELDRLRTATQDEAAGKEAIGKALLAATRASDEILADARASAESVTAEAEAQAEAILEHANHALGQREAEIAAARSKLEEEEAALRAELEREAAAARAAFEEESAAAHADLEAERERVQREKQEWEVHAVGERKRLLDDAGAEADGILVEARGEVERLRRRAQRLRALLAEKQRSFVEVLRSALEQLEGLGPVADGEEEIGLFDDLRLVAVEREADSHDGDAATENEADAEIKSQPGRIRRRQ
jgi:cell division septum initiation protein DivIVA